MNPPLPEAVHDLKPVEKLVWLYIDRYPGDYTMKALEAALGVYVGRAVVTLVALGLLEEFEAPRSKQPGKFRLAERR